MSTTKAGIVEWVLVGVTGVFLLAASMHIVTELHQGHFGQAVQQACAVFSPAHAGHWVNGQGL